MQGVLSQSAIAYSAWQWISAGRYVHQRAKLWYSFTYISLLEEWIGAPHCFIIHVDLAAIDQGLYMWDMHWPLKI